MISRITPFLFILFLLSPIAVLAQEQEYTGIFTEDDNVNEQGWYEDSYTVEVPVGKLLIVDLHSDVFDPYLTVITPSNEKITSDDFLSLSRSRVELIGEESTIHTVLVASKKLMGPYSLKLEVKKGEPSEEFLLSQEAETLLEEAKKYSEEEKFDLALEVLEQALSIKRELGYHFYEGTLLYQKGLIYQTQEEPKIALEHFEIALEFTCQENDFRLENRKRTILNEIAEIYLQQQEANFALINLNQILTKSCKAEYEEAETLSIRILNTIADSFFEQGLSYMGSPLNEQAFSVLLKAKEIYQATGAGHAEGVILLMLGALYEKQDQFEQALNSYQQTLKFFHEAQDDAGKGMVFQRIAELHQELNQTDVALESYIKALEAYRNSLGEVKNEITHKEKSIQGHSPIPSFSWLLGGIGFLDEQKEIEILNKIIEIYLQQEELGSALDYSKQALIRAREIGYPDLESFSASKIDSIASHLFDKGYEYEQSNQLDLALETYKQLLEVYCEVESEIGKMLTFSVIGDVYRNQGKLELAIENFEESVRIAKGIPSDVEISSFIASNLGMIAVIYQQKGQLELALEYLGQALQVSKRIADKVMTLSILSKIASLHQDLNQPELALEHFEQVLQTSEGIADKEATRTIFHQVAQVYQDLNQPELALEYFEQALRASEEIADKEAMWTIFNQIAQAYQDQDQLDLALENHQLSLKVANELDNKKFQGIALNNIGYLYILQNDLDEALEFLEKSLKIRREIQDREGEGNTLNNIGMVYDLRGQLGLALENLEQALQLHKEIKDKEGTAENLYNIAYIYSTLGQSSLAINRYEQAFEIFNEIEYERLNSHMFNSIAFLQHEVGLWDQAIQNYQQSLKISRQQSNKVEEVNTLMLIGQLYESRQEWVLALAKYEQARDISNEIGYKLGEGEAILNITSTNTNEGSSSLEIRTNAYEIALEIFQEEGSEISKGVATMKRARDKFFNTDLSKTNPLSELFDRQAEYEEALKIFQEEGHKTGEATALVQLALVEYTLHSLFEPQEHFNIAYEKYSQALEIFREQGNSLGMATTLNDMGYIYRQEGKFQLALEKYQEAISIIERLRSNQIINETKGNLLSRYAGVYSVAVQLAIEVDKPIEAFLIAESAKSRNFLDELGNNLPNTLQDADPELIAEFRETNQRLNNLERGHYLQQHGVISLSQSNTQNTNTNDQIENLYRSYDELLEQIKRENPEYASLITIEPLKLEEVQASLADEQTLISYFLTLEQSFAFLLTNNSFEVIKLSTKKMELESTLEGFSKTKASILDISPSQQHLAKLYDLLIQPFITKLNTQELVIVPHSSSHFIPFAALWDGEHYLGENYQITHLPSASVLRFLKEKRNPNRGKLFSIASPLVEGYPFLKEASNEAKAIAELYNTIAFIGKSGGTEENFRREVEGKDIIHIASHSVLNANLPLRTQIILAEDERGNEDGLITVQDIYSFDLSSANLVVLSACDTAKGELSNGDDLVGLTRSFIYAGTPSIVATLWTVNDESTKILMVQFHQNVKDGMNYAEALQKAQIFLRENPKYAHPYYWAPFVLVGSKGF